MEEAWTCRRACPRGEMNCRQRLQEYLTSNGVSFEAEQHRVAYTAQEVAAAEHVPGRRVAKVVMAMVDGNAVMLVLPANSRVDLERVKATLGAGEARLEQEQEFANIFPDCEVGAMPPFGNLYGIPVIVEQSLSRSPEITFQAGSHTETMRIRYVDYERLVQPKVLDFAAKPQAAPA